MVDVDHVRLSHELEALCAAHLADERLVLDGDAGGVVLPDDLLPRGARGRLGAIDEDLEATGAALARALEGEAAVRKQCRHAALRDGGQGGLHARELARALGVALETLRELGGDLVAQGVRDHDPRALLGLGEGVHLVHVEVELAWDAAHVALTGELVRGGVGPAPVDLGEEPALVEALDGVACGAHGLVEVIAAVDDRGGERHVEVAVPAVEGVPLGGVGVPDALGGKRPHALGVVAVEEPHARGGDDALVVAGEAPVPGESAAAVRNPDDLVSAIGRGDHVEQPA